MSAGLACFLALAVPQGPQWQDPWYILAQKRGSPFDAVATFVEAVRPSHTTRKGLVFPNLRAIGKPIVLPARLRDEVLRIANARPRKTFKEEPFAPEVVVCFSGPKEVVDVLIDSRSSRIAAVSFSGRLAPASSAEWREGLAGLVQQLRRLHAAP